MSGAQRVELGTRGETRWESPGQRELLKHRPMLTAGARFRRDSTTASTLGASESDSDVFEGSSSEDEDDAQHRHARPAGRTPRSFPREFVPTASKRPTKPVQTRRPAQPAEHREQQYDPNGQSPANTAAPAAASQTPWRNPSQQLMRIRPDQRKSSAFIMRPSAPAPHAPAEAPTAAIAPTAPKVAVAPVAPPATRGPAGPSSDESRASQGVPGRQSPDASVARYQQVRNKRRRIGPASGDAGRQESHIRGQAAGPTQARSALRDEPGMAQHPGSSYDGIAGGGSTGSGYTAGNAAARLAHSDEATAGKCQAAISSSDLAAGKGAEVPGVPSAIPASTSLAVSPAHPAHPAHASASTRQRETPLLPDFRPLPAFSDTATAKAPASTPSLTSRSKSRPPQRSTWPTVIPRAPKQSTPSVSTFRTPIPPAALRPGSRITAVDEDEDKEESPEPIEDTRPHPPRPETAASRKPTVLQQYWNTRNRRDANANTSTSSNANNRLARPSSLVLAERADSELETFATDWAAQPGLLRSVGPQPSRTRNPALQKRSGRPSIAQRSSLAGGNSTGVRHNAAGANAASPLAVADPDRARSPLRLATISELDRQHSPLAAASPAAALHLPDETHSAVSHRGRVESMPSPLALDRPATPRSRLSASDADMAISLKQPYPDNRRRAPRTCSRERSATRRSASPTAIVDRHQQITALTPDRHVIRHAKEPWARRDGMAESIAKAANAPHRVSAQSPRSALPVLQLESSSPKSLPLEVDNPRSPSPDARSRQNHTAAPSIAAKVTPPLRSTNAHESLTGEARDNAKFVQKGDTSSVAAGVECFNLEGSRSSSPSAVDSRSIEAIAPGGLAASVEVSPLEGQKRRASSSAELNAPQVQLQSNAIDIAIDIIEISDSEAESTDVEAEEACRADGVISIDLLSESESDRSRHLTDTRSCSTAASNLNTCEDAEAAPARILSRTRSAPDEVAGGNAVIDCTSPTPQPDIVRQSVAGTNGWEMGGLSANGVIEVDDSETESDEEEDKTSRPAHLQRRPTLVAYPTLGRSASVPADARTARPAEKQPEVYDLTLDSEDDDLWILDIVDTPERTPTPITASSSRSSSPAAIKDARFSEDAHAKVDTAMSVEVQAIAGDDIPSAPGSRVRPPSPPANRPQFSRTSVSAASSAMAVAPAPPCESALSKGSTADELPGAGTAFLDALAPAVYDLRPEPLAARSPLVEVSKHDGESIMIDLRFDDANEDTEIECADVDPRLAGVTARDKQSDSEIDVSEDQERPGRQIEHAHTDAPADLPSLQQPLRPAVTHATPSQWRDMSRSASTSALVESVRVEFVSRSQPALRSASVASASSALATEAAPYIDPLIRRGQAPTQMTGRANGKWIAWSTRVVPGTFADLLPDLDRIYDYGKDRVVKRGIEEDNWRMHELTDKARFFRSCWDRMVHMSKPYPRSSRKNQLDFLHQFLLRFGDIMRRAELRDHFAAHVEWLTSRNLFLRKVEMDLLQEWDEPGYLEAREQKARAQAAEREKRFGRATRRR